MSEYGKLWEREMVEINSVRLELNRTDVRTAILTLKDLDTEIARLKLLRTRMAAAESRIANALPLDR